VTTVVFGALVPGFIIAQAAIALGIPISFNDIIISGGSAGVSRRKIGVTVGFWLITLVTSVAIGFGVYQVLKAALGSQA
jgi:phosphate/sulfate permease